MLRSLARAGSRPGSSGLLWANSVMVVVLSMPRISRPAMVAKSLRTSTPTAVLTTVWWAPPAVSHAVALVVKWGSGCQTARPTGRFGRSCVGGTTVTR